LLQITAVLIGVGLVLLVLTVRRTQKLIGILYEQGPWASLRNLLIFFALGYAVYLSFVILEVPFSRELLVAEVFFLAALFMFLVVRFSFNTIYSILRLDAVEQQRNQDAVTGLFSRDAILYLLNHEFWKAQRFGFPLSLAVVGLDEFGQVEELKKDEDSATVLRELADQMKEDLRSGDLIGRSSETEFLCILPNTSQKGSFITAERLRSRIRSVRFVSENGGRLTVDPRPDQFREGLEISASVGVVTVETEMQTPAEALQAVATALERARGRGGNRVSGPTSDGGTSEGEGAALTPPS
jgi:diguanylate cyclase (GGDEF)-like protein